MNWDEAWQVLYGAKNHIAGRVIAELEAALVQRGFRARQGSDDDLFAYLTTATAILAGNGDYDTAKRLFSECHNRVLSFEASGKCTIHKGAPTFNVGIVFLRSYDFPAAMHYLEQAQEETRKTTGEIDWNVYLSDLFRGNFWDTVEAAMKAYPNKVYASLWGGPLNRDTAIEDWKTLSNHSKLPYIIATAQRVRYRQLATQSQWPDSDALALAYTDLASNLGRILETETRFFSSIDSTIGPMLMQGFKAGAYGDISVDINHLHLHYRVKSIPRYNKIFARLRKTICNPNKARKVRIVSALYLLYATRNQVAHSLDRDLILYSQRDALLSVIDIMFALCHLEEWVV